MISEFCKHWKIIYDNIPEQRIGRFEIIKDSGQNTSLIEHSDPFMVWTSMDENEWHLYQELHELAYGKVLIAGLGLGFDLLNVSDKDGVDEIVVVEKQQAVIDLVWPYIPHQKAILVHQDILEYLRNIKERFNIIYFDIFPGGCESFPEQTNLLREAAQFKLELNGQIIFWREILED
jgi:spermidine synthase